MTGTRRLWLLACLAGVLLAGGLADTASTPSLASLASPPAGGIAMASVRQPRSVSTTWYCAGQTATPGAAADGDVVIADLGATAVQASLTAVPDSGPAVTQQAAIAPRSQVVLPPRVTSAHVAETVRTGPGVVVVSQVVDGPLGETSALCSSTTSALWYFADGSTVQGDTVSISLYNPGSTDAVADLSFATDQGPVTPGDFQGVLVPADALVVLDVGDHVLDRHHVATQISTRSGRLVAFELETRTSSAPSGVTLVEGTPSTSPVWWFPYAVSGGPGTETFSVYNPSSRTAQVRVLVGLVSGSAAPLGVAVAPGGLVTVDASSQPRVPPSVRQAVEVESTNGVAVVVQRELVAPPPYTGRVGMIGAVAGSGDWLVPPASVGTIAGQEWLAVQAAGAGPARVSVVAIAGGGVQPVALPAAGSVAQPGAGLWVEVPPTLMPEFPSLEVSSTSPVTVEAEYFPPVGSAGMSASLGLP